MRAAWYEQQGRPEKVLSVGEMPSPEPGPGEVRIRIAASGINPGDVKKRSDAFGVGMPYPRVIPHSDGAGVIDAVGENVPESRTGERVWCFGAQSYRAFGTAAEQCVVPANQAVALPEGIPFEQGACLGIPGITAHRAVHAGGSVEGKTVLVQGGAGAVGQCAVALARHAGAHVIATVRSGTDREVAERAGAHAVVRTEALSSDEARNAILKHTSAGVDHVVEVAFHANIALDESVLNTGGSVGTYATGDPSPAIPFWPLVFKNIRIYFLGSDDFTAQEKSAAASDLNRALEAGWAGFAIHPPFDLTGVADAHALVENRGASGRVIVRL